MTFYQYVLQSRPVATDTAMALQASSLEAFLASDYAQYELEQEEEFQPRKAPQYVMESLQ